MKPKVICHIMSSVDGRLLPGRWTQPLDGTSPAELFGVYAAIGRSLGTDAWMFGKATTAEVFPDKYIPTGDRHPAPGEVHIAARDSARLFITVDPDADILYTSGRLRGDNIVTVVGTNATTDYLAMLEDKGISYIVLDDTGNLPAAMDILHDRFGVKSVSLQGGGIIDGAMLAARLIDELSLVIYPGIDGASSSPSIFEYIGAHDKRPAAGQSLELVSVEKQSHGVVWLRYRFHKNNKF